MTTKKRSTNSSKQTIKSRRPAREGSLSTHTEKAQASLKRALPVISLPARIKPIIYAFILALIIVVGGWLFYSRIYINPQRVFATMISNNLSTDGFTRQTTQSACVPNAQSTNIIQTSFTPSLTLHCITHINNGSVRLVIESIGTTQADYQHY